MTPSAKHARASSPPQKRPPNLERHQRRCKICHHPDRHWIEDDILHWRSPDDIVARYGLPDRSNIYRHARALGLLSQRRRATMPALAAIIERAGDARPSQSAVVKAIEIHLRLNELEKRESARHNPPQTND